MRRGSASLQMGSLPGSNDCLGLGLGKSIVASGLGLSLFNGNAIDVARLFEVLDLGLLL